MASRRPRARLRGRGGREKRRSSIKVLPGGCGSSNGAKSGFLARLLRRSDVHCLPRASRDRRKKARKNASAGKARVTPFRPRRPHARAADVADREFHLRANKPRGRPRFFRRSSSSPPRQTSLRKQGRRIRIKNRCRLFITRGVFLFIECNFNRRSAPAGRGKLLKAAPAGDTLEIVKIHFDGATFASSIERDIINWGNGNAAHVVSIDGFACFETQSWPACACFFAFHLA